MSTPNTPLSAWHDSLRSLLGDRDALYGENEYTDATLDSAVRSVFAMAKAPDGCELHDDSDAVVAASALITATNVFPLLAIGSAAFAEIFFRAALLLVAGEDGAMALTTRAMSARESGDRKRQLFDWLCMEISDIEATGTFTTGAKNWDQYLQGR